MEKTLKGWTPQEIEALKRATDKLKNNDQQKDSKKITGVYRDESHGFYVVYANLAGKNIYAGRLDALDEEKIIEMKEKAISTYKRIFD